MLLSADKKFLFVHIQKTGGSSIGTVLRERVPDVRHFLGTHDFAVKAWDALGDGVGVLFFCRICAKSVGANGVVV